jgi:hypothetical protein
MRRSRGLGDVYKRQLPNFARVSDDTFMVVLEARDPQFHLDDSRNFLQSLGGQEIIVIRD